jgi:Fe-S cluster assembly ATP-binding protein
MNALLSIKDLHVSVDGKAILNGIDLVINTGEVHAIMGPNGSGKSTFAQVLAGHEQFEVTRGSIRYADQDLLTLAPEERARAGIFLAFQYPGEIPGVSNIYLLKTAFNAIRNSGEKRSWMPWIF